MPTRPEYNACMSPYITGKKPVEQRRLDFCIGAKVCSGKAATPEEAEKVCLSTPPKPPKPRKPRSKTTCSQDMIHLATCLSQTINITELTSDNLETTLAEMLQQCHCERTKATPTPTLTAEQMEALQVISQMKTDYSDGSVREMPVMR